MLGKDERGIQNLKIREYRRACEQHKSITSSINLDLRNITKNSVDNQCRSIGAPGFKAGTFLCAHKQTWTTLDRYHHPHLLFPLGRAQLRRHLAALTSFYLG